MSPIKESKDALAFRNALVSLIYSFSKLCFKNDDKSGPKTVHQVCRDAMLTVSTGKDTHEEFVKVLEKEIRGLVEYRPCMNAQKMRGYNIFVVTEFENINSAIEDILTTRGHNGLLTSGFAVINLV